MIPVGIFDLDGGDVTERFVQTVVVEPVDPFQDGQFHLSAGPPDAISDQLGLERVDKALGQCVVVGVADRPDRRQDAVVVEDLRVVVAEILRPVVGVLNQRKVRPRSRVPSAIRSASRTRSVRMWDANCQPTILRLNTSMMKLK